MTNLAAIQADYRIIKPVAGRGCYILQLEVPWEAFDEVNMVLGAPPKPGENRWVGVALINPIHARRAHVDKQEESEEKPSNKAILTPGVRKGLYGDYAAKLYKCGFFLNEAVLEVLGTDDEFRAWVRKQPSAITGKFSEYDNGEPVCEAAHVRRASHSGTAYKGKFLCIPLSHMEHQRQHQHGEEDLLGVVKIKYEGTAKDWFWKQRCHYVQEWGKQRLKDEFGASHLSDISPRSIMEWAKLHDLTKYLPRVASGDEEIPI